MKHLLFLFLVIPGLSYSQNNKSEATVNQVNGIYLFINSTPVADFDTVGMIHQDRAATYRGFLIQINDIKNLIPETEAVILNADLTEGAAIKFK